MNFWQTRPSLALETQVESKTKVESKTPSTTIKSPLSLFFRLPWTAPTTPIDDGERSDPLLDSLDASRFPALTGPPTRQHWKHDSASTVCDDPLCQQAFDYLFQRRHHCRRCGNIFCESHSRFRVPLDQLARYHPRADAHRACAYCFHEYQTWRDRQSDTLPPAVSPLAWHYPADALASQSAVAAAQSSHSSAYSASTSARGASASSGSEVARIGVPGTLSSSVHTCTTISSSADSNVAGSPSSRTSTTPTSSASTPPSPPSTSAQAKPIPPTAAPAALLPRHLTAEASASFPRTYTWSTF